MFFSLKICNSHDVFFTESDLFLDPATSQISSGAMDQQESLKNTIREKSFSVKDNDVEAAVSSIISSKFQEVRLMFPHCIIIKQKTKEKLGSLGTGFRLFYRTSFFVSEYGS